MTIEQQLKSLILTKYKSIRSFTIAIEVPYSTIDTMLKNGICGTGVVTVLKVCLALGIDIEGLLNNEIIKKDIATINADGSCNECCSDNVSSTVSLSPDLSALSVALEQLNDEGTEKLLDYASDLVAGGRYIKTGSAGLGQKEA